MGARPVVVDRTDLEGDDTAWTQRLVATRCDPLLPLDRDVHGVRGEEDSTRTRSWRRLNESGRPQDAFVFLLSVLGSPLEPESAAAACSAVATAGPGTRPEYLARSDIVALVGNSQHG